MKKIKMIIIEAVVVSILLSSTSIMAANILTENVNNNDGKSLDGFPLYAQTGDCLSGAAVCQMMLNYYNHQYKNMGQIDIAHKLEWHAGFERYNFHNYENYFKLPCEIKSKNDANLPSKDQLWNNIVTEIESDDPVHLVQPNFRLGEDHSIVIAGYSNIDNKKELLVYDPWPPAPSEYSGGIKQWITYDTVWGEEGPDMVIYLESKSGSPTVEITKPVPGYIYKNNEVWVYSPTSVPLIFGKCDIEIELSDDVVASKTECYIDGERVSPEDWKITSGHHTYSICVYDEDGNGGSDSVTADAIFNKEKSLQHSLRYILFSTIFRFLEVSNFKLN